jgi:hypothetical protein
MNRMQLSLWVAVLTIAAGLEGFGPKTVVSPRSQSLFLPREHAGWDNLIYRPDADTTRALFAIAPSYQHRFRGNVITESLLGCKNLIFSGSQVANRDDTDILADYWGLPSDFKSQVHFDPIIAAFVMDFDMFIALDGVTPGLFAEVHLPMVHTRWDLQLTECIADMGTTYTSYPAGYLASTPIELSTLTMGDAAPKDVQTAFQGNATFGDMREPLKYGKIFGRQDESRVSDLRLAVGYNIVRDQYHVGFSLRAAAPTGTNREAEFLFEPIAGNDHHWELGAGFSGHADLWCNREEDKKVGLYVDGIVTHMFASTQKRSFDLTNNGCGSRYILLEKMADPVSNLYVGTALDNSLSPTQYQGRLVPAINITTLDAKIAIGVQAEFLAKLQYYSRGFEFEIGYDLWARSKETLSCRGCIPESCYAVKGDAQVYGFTNPGETPVALAATQSKATINNGQTADLAGAKPGNFTSGFEYANLNADSQASAYDATSTGLNQLTLADANRLGISQITVRSSNPPVFLTNDDINECSALLPKAISHTAYFAFSYSHDRDDLDVIPFIGGGAFVEWGSSCLEENSALSQWGLWIRMGVAIGS